jgi:dipeptidyl aminopeptidase/acylaminoacyl peptidase
MPPNVPAPGKDLAAANGAKLLGAIPRERPDLARQVSPLYQVSKDDPPFLIIHGDKDPQVPLEQSERLHARLQQTGVRSELIVLPGAGHGGPAFSTPEIKGRIRDFLLRAMPPKA